MVLTTRVSPNMEPFQSSQALYDALEALMADEKTLRLSHDELEDLLAKEYAKLHEQLYLDALNLLAMSNERQTEQLTDVHVDERQGEEPVIVPNLDLAFAGPSRPSPQDTGLDDGLLTTEGKGIVMSTDAPPLTTAQATDRLSEPLVGLCGCGKLIGGGGAASIAIPIPCIPQNVLSFDANMAGQHETKPGGCKRFTVVNGIPVIASQVATAARSPAPPLVLLSRARAAFPKVHTTTSDIIPRAA